MSIDAKKAAEIAAKRMHEGRMIAYKAALDTADGMVKFTQPANLTIGNKAAMIKQYAVYMGAVEYFVESTVPAIQAMPKDIMTKTDVKDAAQADLWANIYGARILKNIMEGLQKYEDEEGDI